MPRHDRSVWKRSIARLGEGLQDVAPHGYEPDPGFLPFTSAGAQGQGLGSALACLRAA